MAAIGGAASGALGGRRIGTIFTVEAPDMPAAAKRAIDRITAVVAGEVLSIEISTTEEFDRRLDEPEPQLVGVSEIAAMLEVSKQRVSELSKRDDFPAPLVVLASGPVWRAGDLSRFREGWRRQPGRPRGVS